MKKNILIRLSTALLVIVLCAVSVCTVLALNASADDNIYGGTKTNTFDKTEAVEELLATSNHFVVVKQKQMGGTHYAYTDALYEHQRTGPDVHYEYNFNSGAQLVILSVLDNGNGTVSTYEKIILNTKTGVIRDPSVSPDGTKVLYSYKATTYDEYHIYEKSLTDLDAAPVQLTFGNGRSDFEPQYLANGDIVFSSNRATQTVDCWITPVANLYVMSGDGSNIRRVGYDQVHTTYPTVTADGRVLYTRWDYNDRTQMFVQGVFQMFQDGTYQTEVWGNNANFPTTLLHTRDIPGATGKYISIASGHHVQQVGKLCIVDTTVERNDKDAIQFVFPDAQSNYATGVDGYGQGGRIYKYPYAINDHVFLVSSAASYSDKNTAFSIYLCDMTKGWNGSIELVKGNSNMPASQIVPIKTSEIFNRSSAVNYASNAGTYYVANVYEGEAVEGVEVGTAKYLRVVEIVYRSSSIGATYQSTTGANAGDPFSPIATGHGAWDVKAVLGIVPVEADGSVMFKVPSDTPVYFQLLDENGSVIQTMRSWSTLMPGETFSCVGCHESKNSAPTANSTVTLAMKKGAQELQPDLWMKGHEDYEDFDPYTDDSIGFSYDMVQDIFNESCISCHNNVETSLKAINSTKANIDDSVDAIGYLIARGQEWQYSISGGKSGTSYAPFGKVTAAVKDINTIWNSGTLTLTNTFNFSQWHKDSCTTLLELKYSGNITVKLNGTTVYTNSSSTITEVEVELTEAQIQALKNGANKIEITVSGTGYYADAAFRSYAPTGNLSIFDIGQDWSYVMSASGSEVGSDWYKADFDDSSWKVSAAPFGDRGGQKTSWTGSPHYLWLRRTFTLTAEQVASMKDGIISAKTFYDNDIVVYINGVQVFNKAGWVDSYVSESFSGKPQNIFKAGENVIAVSLHDTGGGRQFDLGLSCTVSLGNGSSDQPFALIGDLIDAESNRMRRAFPLSYLVLTGSLPSQGANQVGTNQWIGNYNNKYIKWISSMSQPEVLDAYSAGSAKSALITKLRGGHGNLSDEDIRLISAWIDLTVPCFGSYDENEGFNEDEARAFVERENKRNFYEQWDRYVKLGLAGNLPEGTVEVSHSSGSSAKGNGWTILYLNSQFKAGQTITVKVTGSKYVAVSLNERQGEALLYVPNGTFTFKIPADLINSYNVTMRGSGSVTYYRNPTIMVRIPTADELAEERNLAVNAYDLNTSDTGAFPHASAVTATTGTAAPHCAIDGFVSNKSSGSWPYQAWTPAASDKNAALTIDFGREVVANTLKIKMRAASNDTHVINAVVTFSDGSTMELSMWDTTEFMTFDLGGKTITKLTIGNFTKAVENGTISITEVQVIGTEK